MKKGKLSFVILIILIIIAAIVSCENRFVIDILPDRSKIKPVVPKEPDQDKAYKIVINISDDETGDKVTASPESGDEGDIITLSYVVANTKHYNLLDFGGVTSPIASVESAESGTRTYTIDAEDASNGIITITAVFLHTDLVPDPIAFTDTEGHINKNYGDVFTNAIAVGYLGTGAITYSSSDPDVASVDGLGQVTIHKVGSTVISAEKAADTVYASAQKDYTLAVDPKPVTITGLSIADKQYDGKTTATVTGTAVIDGLIAGDDVTVNAGTAAFLDAASGYGKTVTFSDWSLSGADAVNYTLSAQPTDITADIKGIIDMVPIPAGTFQMGSPASEPNRSSNETQHSVTLTKSYYMGKYQVTQAQYHAVMGAGEDRTTTTYGKGDNYPIYYVNWYDAIVFCNKLSMMEGLNPVYSIGGSTDPAVWITNNGGTIPTSSNATWNAAVMDMSKNGYRLPTEAEWEYSCRGSYANKATETNTKPFGIGDGTKITGSMANFDGRYPYDLAQSGQYNDTGGAYLGKTTAIGSYAANNYGLYDMHGNLYEWCWDWYDSSYYSSSPANNPTGAVTGSYRVRRGGDWDYDGQYLRSAYRYDSDPSYRGDLIGFRLVRS
jgi:formylglycine-generating enzyme required for sulfatase activity